MYMTMKGFRVIASDNLLNISTIKFFDIFSSFTNEMTTYLPLLALLRLHRAIELIISRFSIPFTRCFATSDTAYGHNYALASQTRNTSFLRSKVQQSNSPFCFCCGLMASIKNISQCVYSLLVHSH
jgi:hypothetical protein